MVGHHIDVGRAEVRGRRDRPGGRAPRSRWSAAPPGRRRTAGRRRCSPRPATRDAEPGRGVALRVEVDHQHPVPERRQRGAEVDRGRGLADAALLVGDGEDMGRGPRFRHVRIAPISTMAARGSVRLGMSLWSKRQRADASAISLCTVRALGKQADTPRPAMFFQRRRAGRRAAPGPAPRRRRRAAAADASSALGEHDRPRRPDRARRRSRGRPPCAGRSRPAAPPAPARLRGRARRSPARESRRPTRGRASAGRPAGAAARAGPSRRSGGARRPAGVDADDEVDPRVPLSRAARRAPPAAPLFHVKHRRRRGTPPASARHEAARARLASGGPRRSTSVSAAGVIPSIRAAWPRRLRAHRLELVPQLARKPADRAVVESSGSIATASSRRSRATSAPAARGRAHSARRARPAPGTSRSLRAKRRKRREHRLEPEVRVAEQLEGRTAAPRPG